MGSRAEDLTRRFEEASNAFIKDVEGVSESDWRNKTTSEGWSVAACAHHAAISPEPIAAMVTAAATGGQMPPITADMLNQMNAKHAQDYAACTREETIAAMRTHTATAANAVRGLSDVQLARSAMLPFGMEMTAEQIIENVLIGHILGHSQSMKEAALSAR